GRKIGLNISTDFPSDIADLIRLFPERVRSSARWTRSQGEARQPSLAPREPSAEETPFTGYQPGPGARSFSYGPWNPNTLRPQGHAPGPGYADLREDRSLRRPSRERE
ncbi:MAG: hypothetical protein K2Q06_01465, partial [Parvularculaceae bacterium]|nr:hypothetical protein [Parvularculaceae bacterium]